MRSLLSVLSFGLVLLIASCQASNEQKASEDTFGFSEITFHTSPCFGSCPKISVHINKDRNIEVSRQFYKGKVEPDTTNSGNFKGQITEADYKQLIGLLEKIDWETIEFPKVMCCDAPVRTILLSHNNKSYEFKSMTPPETTTELTQFLVKLASSPSLPRYEQEIIFKDIRDQGAGGQ